MKKKRTVLGTFLSETRKEERRKVNIVWETDESEDKEETEEEDGDKDE